MRLIDLELDLDVFAGPFDLLLTLILREEVDLLEVDLAEVVITYIDHLERRGELELEAATEFLVLIAALLELKSRLMLPGEDQEEIELDPGEAAQELLARLLDAHRYRAAAESLRQLLSAVQAARKQRKAILWGMGGHVIKVGLGPVLVDLMDRAVLFLNSTRRPAVSSYRKPIQVGRESRRRASELSVSLNAAPGLPGP